MNYNLNIKEKEEKYLECKRNLLKLNNELNQLYEVRKKAITNGQYLDVEFRIRECKKAIEWWRDERIYYSQINN